MGLYKGIEVPDELAAVMDHMYKLDQDRDQLSVLSQQWDLLTILGQMTGSGADMTKTRENFKELTAKLITALGHETLRKVVQSLTGKAQVTVDIVIRNLFERTADIGFLATDDDIRSFLSFALSENPEAGELEARADQLKHRFLDYVSKYSVYENIILMDMDGRVLCQLDEKNKILQPDNEIMQAVFETEKEYLETFGKTSLCPEKDQALLYSFRVRESQDPQSRVVGILCLVFRFENELESVFRNLLPENEWTILTLLDNQGRVIATSDSIQAPVHSKQSFAIDKEYSLTQFGGRLYLSKTCATKGYQGFSGLGWFGHAMIPVEHAFRQNEAEKQSLVQRSVLDSVTDEPRLFSEQLRKIPRDADLIQSELDRTVWNGNLATHLKQDAQQALSNKVLLWEISSTGYKTKRVFEKSINELHQTVVNSLMTDLGFVSSLAIDIMDRNLYERANDCRWWSLTTSFQKILSESSPTPAQTEEMQKVLAYINGLYTVYTNIYVFDRQGTVVAVSKPSESALVGKNMTDDFTKSILSLRSAQSYRVSKFEGTELYGHKPTYVYGAAILDADSSTRVVGGIGIVFDSEPQFRQILEDSLPRDKEGRILDGAYSAFVDRSGVIISSSNKNHKVGTIIEISDEFLNLKNGDKYSDIIVIDNKYYAVGACCSKGYREYKGETDEYKCDIIALTFMLLGEVRAAKTGLYLRDTEDKVRHLHRSPGVSYADVATFHIGSLWVGIRAEHVESAIIATHVTQIPSKNKALRGAVMYNDRPIYLVDPYESLGLTKMSEDLPEVIQAVVIKTEFGLVSISIDRLGEIPVIAEDQIKVDAFLSGGDSKYIEGIVRLESSAKNSPMLVVVEPSEFVKCLVGERQGMNLKDQMLRAEGEGFADLDPELLKSVG